LISLFLFGFLFVVNADQCLGTPNTLGSGANCGGAISCVFGLYCDATATCSPYIAAGASCNSAISNQCGPTATCKGPTGSQTCVNNSSPGQACSTSSTDSVGICPTGFGLFTCLNSVCQGGMVGDSCTQTTDCASSMNLTCVSGVCTGVPNNGFCISSMQCIPGSVCLNGLCTPTIATGTCTLANSQICSFGSFCLYNPLANTTQCIQAATLPQGSYCGGISGACQNSLRCVNNFCTNGRVTNCAASSACSADEYCNCGGLYKLYGTGQCQKNQCLDGLTKWVTCVNQFCQGTSVLNGISVIPAAVSYTKSCILNNCAAQYNTYMQCNAASPLVGSVFLVAVLALFAQFFSKEF